MSVIPPNLLTYIIQMLGYSVFVSCNVYNEGIIITYLMSHFDNRKLIAVCCMTVLSDTHSIMVIIT